MKTIKIGGVDFPEKIINEFKETINQLDFVELTVIASERAKQLPNLSISDVFNQLMNSENYNPKVIAVYAKSLIMHWGLMQEKEYIDALIANRNESEIYDYGFMQGICGKEQLADKKIYNWSGELKDKYFKGYEAGAIKCKMKKKN